MPHLEMNQARNVPAGLKLIMQMQGQSVLLIAAQGLIRFPEGVVIADPGGELARELMGKLHARSVTVKYFGESTGGTGLRFLAPLISQVARHGGVGAGPPTGVIAHHGGLDVIAALVDSGPDLVRGGEAMRNELGQLLIDVGADVIRTQALARGERIRRGEEVVGVASPK